MTRIHVETPYHESFRTATVAGMFDVPVTERLQKSWDVDLPHAEEDWSIGLIVGPSGSGKTTLAREFYGKEVMHGGYKWPRAESLLDGFPEAASVKDITAALSHVGFSSPPAWLLPFHCLSNGQQFRAELARLLLDEAPLVVVDEFTSVVDRNVAKAASCAVSKAVRKKAQKRLIACSCHYDIVQWLEPDWVYDVAQNTLTRRRLRRPQLRISVHEVDRSAWHVFKSHHYLSANIHKAAKCFGAYLHDQLVGFCAVIHFPNPHYKNAKRIHRTVVLPDYQGLGIGNALVMAVGNWYRDHHFRVFATTSHPASIHYRARSPLWRMTRRPSHASLDGNSTLQGGADNSRRRLTASFEYLGSPDEHREQLLTKES